MGYWAMHNKKKILLVAAMSAVTVVFLGTVAVIEACRLVQERYDY